MSNTRPSSPRSNASTPRGARDARGDDFDNLDLGFTKHTTPRHTTPRHAITTTARWQW